MEATTTTTEMDLSAYFKIDKTKEFDKAVTKFVTENGNSPFVDISMEETEGGNVKIDFDAGFEKDCVDAFGDELNELVSDYVTALIQVMLDNKDILQAPEASGSTEKE